MKKTFLLATIIVNYKSEERTIKYIKEELLIKCTIPQIIIIVNNGATEESSELLCASLNACVIRDINTSICESKIYVIHNTRNSGFAKGNNLGVDFISEHFNVKYLLFSNNDIRFIDSNVVEVLIEKLESLPDVGVIGPKVVGLDGNCQSPNEYVSFWTEMVGQYWERFIPFYKIEHFNQNKAQEGYYYRVMGSFFMVRYSDFIECGMFDPKTFLYGEEVILSERMNLIERKNYYTPIVSVVHEHGSTTSKHINQISGNLMIFNSLSYYYHKYMGVNLFYIKIAQLLIWIYSYMQYLARKLK